MVEASDLSGLMAMMPAFATDDAVTLRAKNTIDVERLRTGLDRMINDGANVIATTGSFGECHTLLIDEYETLAREAIDVAKGRVPLFIGVTSSNARETVQKIEIAERLGAEAVLVGIPYYFPSTVENAVRFLVDIAEMFPRLGIVVYHNPALHHVALPVEAFPELTKHRNIIAMKDSHRDPVEFMRLEKIVADKISVFCFQGQYFQYSDLGAPGFWSIDAWMGPWPQLALRDAVSRGDREAAAAITLDIMGPNTVMVNPSWRETARKIAIRMAGYVDPGPLRPPFVQIPTEVTERQKKAVERWKGLCEKYRPKTAAASS
jgi:dihydrodipicolinate synthase/N-acetylneuraminate lyase